MGFAQSEITLKNIRDKIKVEEGYIKEHEIRQATVQAVVDTGAMTLVINETVTATAGAWSSRRKTSDIG